MSDASRARSRAAMRKHAGWPKKFWYLPCGYRRDGTQGRSQGLNPSSIAGMARKRGLKPGVINRRKKLRWPKKFWYLPSGYRKDGTQNAPINPNSWASKARDHGLRPAIVILRKMRGWPEKFWFAPRGWRLCWREDIPRPLTKKQLAKARGRRGSVADPNSVAGKAREHGLPPATVYTRRAAGWPEKFWYAPLGSRKDGSRICFFGLLAQKEGVPRGTVKSRLKRKMPLALALHAPTLSVIPALAAQAGTPLRTVHQRLAQGVPLERALDPARLPLSDSHRKHLVEQCRREARKLKGTKRVFSKEHCANLYASALRGGAWHQARGLERL